MRSHYFCQIWIFFQLGVKAVKSSGATFGHGCVALEIRDVTFIKACFQKEFVYVICIEHVFQIAFEILNGVELFKLWEKL